MLTVPLDFCGKKSHVQIFLWYITDVILPFDEMSDFHKEIFSMVMITHLFSIASNVNW